jgi:hypothetical protein
VPSRQPVPVPDFLPEARFRHSSSPRKDGEEINLELADLNLPFQNRLLFLRENLCISRENVLQTHPFIAMDIAMDNVCHKHF